LMLDERGGVSYPDGQQAADGTIYITYDFDRIGKRHILFSTFREEDVLAGKPVSGAVRLRQIVSEGSGGAERPKPQVNANADGAPLAAGGAGLLAAEVLDPVAFKAGVTLFTDRSYTLAEVPDALKDARFLRVSMDGPKTLRCTRAGMVAVLTPLPERNSDSVSKALLEQGFQKVRLPEVRLFDPANPRNFCTLFQKRCAEGETVTFGKWGLPLFYGK